MKSRILNPLKRYWKVLLGIVALVAMIVWTSGALNERVAPDALPREAGFPVAPDAEQFTVQVESIARRLEVAGTVTSEEMIHLSARINAHVQAVHAGAGQVVKKDELLIELDDREWKEQLAAAEAQAHQANSEYARTKQLFESAASTQQALIAAEAAKQTARAQVDRAKIMLSFTEIRSPIDGVITHRRIEPGDLAAPGQVLLAVYNPTAMRLDAPVPVRLVKHLALGDEVDVELERPATVLTGTVTEIVSEIDPTSRTQRVKVRLDGAQGPILPGTFGRIRIAGTPTDGVCVPKSAVYQVGQLEMVQVVQDARVLRRLVKTGSVANGRVEILSGLSAGETILTHPMMEN